MFAYVGPRTTRERNARGDGISVFRCDPAFTPSAHAGAQSVFLAPTAELITAKL
jgi:hypothetical protein